jgi:hypothetical protein
VNPAACARPARSASDARRAAAPAAAPAARAVACVPGRVADSLGEGGSGRRQPRPEFGRVARVQVAAALGPPLPQRGRLERAATGQPVAAAVIVTADLMGGDDVAAEPDVPAAAFQALQPTVRLRLRSGRCGRWHPGPARSHHDRP